MGIGLWLGMGLLAALIARWIPHARPSGRLPESLGAIGTAVLAGVAATTLDVGGGKEPDWRAGLFALACALAVIGLIRLARVKS